MREAFLELDKGSTGTITAADFKKVLEDNFHIPELQAETVFNAIGDVEHDEIHYSEFLAAMMASRISLHDDLLKDAFRRFDTENTGFIRKEDLVLVSRCNSQGQASITSRLSNGFVETIRCSFFTPSFSSVR